MLIVGLTGGIGSGKSSVSQLFESHSVPVIDMDVIAREVTIPGSATLIRIVEEFGDDILCEDGSLNRKLLRQNIFQSEEKRRSLESILHPEIRVRTQEKLDELTQRLTDYCLVVIPLLAESSHPFPVDRVLVIDASIEQQIQRTCTRDGLSEQMASKIIAAQSPRKERLNLADDVIENNVSIEALRLKVADLHQFYLKLANTT